MNKRKIIATGIVALGIGTATQSEILKFPDSAVHQDFQGDSLHFYRLKAEEAAKIWEDERLNSMYEQVTDIVYQESIRPIHGFAKAQAPVWAVGRIDVAAESVHVEIFHPQSSTEHTQPYQCNVGQVNNFDSRFDYRHVTVVGTVNVFGREQVLATINQQSDDDLECRYSYIVLMEPDEVIAFSVDDPELRTEA